MRLGIKNTISKQSFLNHENATENLFELKSDVIGAWVEFSRVIP